MVTLVTRLAGNRVSRGRTRWGQKPGFFAKSLVGVPTWSQKPGFKLGWRDPIASGHRMVGDALVKI
ncbi:MAG: hypothetical protein GDA43_20055 [Hormoscilla sp. SP5CHS1]|nr:hypothetical protein [Hormoscilla sp. SP12CHS1]MBC6455209.1 hypothetical protein [Hormoscilla sp. SP5CHS1]